MSEWRRSAVPEVLVQKVPNTRIWQKDVEDGHLTVIRTREQFEHGGPWLTHVSISHRTSDLQPGRYPTWDEQKDAVWTFAAGKTMHSILPPEHEPYVNVHETTFHWWEMPSD